MTDPDEVILATGVNAGFGGTIADPPPASCRSVASMDVKGGVSAMPREVPGCRATPSSRLAALVRARIAAMGVDRSRRAGDGVADRYSQHSEWQAVRSEARRSIPAVR